MRAADILRETAHRPWPLSRGPWVMRQTWHELLFAHWPVPPAALASHLPPALAPALDTQDGSAWLGIVPFRMSDVRPRLFPAVPWLSAFPELNVRTYVTLDGKPGVYFFSLDAANPIAVRLARALFFLPYFTAAMRSVRKGDRVEYASDATHPDGPARLRATYGPVGPAYHPRPGALDDFLTARYCLYTAGPRGGVYRAEIHHLPWPLQPAAADFAANTLAASHGLALPDTPPLLHYASRLDVLVWPPHRAV
jgi:uncharacterized protein YqjF (DUF2071 family)